MPSSTGRRWCPSAAAGRSRGRKPSCSATATTLPARPWRLLRTRRRGLRPREAGSPPMRRYLSIAPARSPAIPATSRGHPWVGPPVPNTSGRTGADVAGRTSLRLELHGDAVDAVAQTGRRRPVLEHVSEMAATAAAMHLSAYHAVACVRRRLDRAGRGIVEARPAGAALELLLRH